MRTLLMAILTMLITVSAGSSAFAYSGGGGSGRGSDSLSTEESVVPENAGIKIRRLRISPAEINPNFDKVTRWDTNDINMYHVDMTSFRDTLTYTFTVEGERGYSIPKEGRVTSGFGRRRLFGRKFHKGVDIDLETGDEVRAALPGKVRIARYSSGYGNFVVISHEGGLETLYGHLSELLVDEGAVVTSGESIGLGGSTGQSTGSHLHFEIRIFGEQIDPAWIINLETLQPHTDVVRVDASWFNHLLHHTEKSFHIVEAGQTLDQICRMYEVEAEELISINQLDPDKELEEGLRLQLD